jgi:hypothetical protein
VDLLLSLLFTIFSFSGLITILQLVRLRLAWFESMEAMNTIKAYYVHRFPGMHLKDALRWHAGSAPTRYKAWSISHLLALQAAILSGVSLAAAVYYFGLFTGWNLLVGAPLTGVIYCVAQMETYRRMLQGKK